MTTPALADDPAVSAQPNVQPGANGSTVGGSASADGGDAGPATFTSSEPITASSTNTSGSTGPSSGTTSASGPGTTATVPTNAYASEPDPAAPDGSAPETTTSGPLERNSREGATVLGIELPGLPSTATEPASVSLLGATLALAGLVLLQRARRKS